MPQIINELKRRDLTIPVLVGGAAINPRFGRRILFTEDGVPYDPGVFYCKDAFDGLSVMEALVVPEQKEQLLAEVRAQAVREMGREVDAQKTSQIIQHSSVPPAPSIPQPPSWGARVVRDMPLELIFQHLYKRELFRLSWGAKNARGEEWERLQAEFEARLTRMQKEALKDGWLRPQGVYGYWPAQSEGNDLILYDPSIADDSAGKPKEIVRFHFPRQSGGERLCLADYFASVESGIMDIVALQVVTVGRGATERFDRLQDKGDFSEAYFTHGLAVQTAEAAAEYLYRHIHRELGIPEERGKRYSWGYPAIPDLSDHRIVFDLLPAESDLGMSLTSAYQLVPEQSTAAIFVHHPMAKYFNVGK